jgi:hypothetical protein
VPASWKELCLLPEPSIFRTMEVEMTPECKIHEDHSHGLPSFPNPPLENLLLVGMADLAAGHHASEIRQSPNAIVWSLTEKNAYCEHDSAHTNIRQIQAKCLFPLNFFVSRQQWIVNIRVPLCHGRNSGAWNARPGDCWRIWR